MAQTVFNHVGVNCNDPLVIERFYTKYFGFKRIRVYLPGPEQVVVIQKGPLALELFKATKPLPVPLPVDSGIEYSGWRHICFEVDNLDETLAMLGDSIRLTQGPVDMGVFVPGMRVCWVADPEGNILELNQGFVAEDNPPPLL
jgi:glyoxylase I family protein